MFKIVESLKYDYAIIWTSSRKSEHRCYTCKMVKHHVSLGMGEKQARALAVRENREAIAKLIDQCKAIDQEAGEKIHSLLDKM